jgi:hypothetical protein
MAAAANPSAKSGFAGGWFVFRTGHVVGLLFPILLVLANSSARAAATYKEDKSTPWSLVPLVRPEVPAGVTKSSNPIDAFVAAEYQAKTLKPVGRASKQALLRRVYLDLVGLPPSPEEQDAFLRDTSPDAYEKVVDRLLASEQHAVRYSRHWLDVLRYADTDDKMVAAPGIYLWRDWVIKALNEDLPYDQFVRAQLTGYRTNSRTEVVATGFRLRVQPRAEDMFALGFLARGGASIDVKDEQDLAISAVETVSTAFMGMTVGCAKCHDHEYDPILQRDFYAMKALFDPLVLRKVTLASADEIYAHSRALDAERQRRAAIEGPLNELVAPYKKKLYEERLAMVPAEVRTILAKPEKERTVEEQKLADSYYPVLRIDSEKIAEVLPEPERKRYEEAQAQLDPKKSGHKVPDLPAFWTVEVDHGREHDASYILDSGNPEKPDKTKPVTPGWPFAPTNTDFREGRIEAFSDWLTAPENPLFARVAINRLWQWHFGEGLQKTPSDFGRLGGTPSNQKLLDWLASEFVERKFSMKQMHRLMVTSDTYKLASEVEPALAEADSKFDPANAFLWHFRLQRLEAEPIWDSILSAAENLNLSVGGPSFDVAATPEKPTEGATVPAPVSATNVNRRAAYMTRGYSSGHEALPAFLKAFDVDDGLVPCPMRTQTVTAPQALFLMNGEEVELATERFADRLKRDSKGDLKNAVALAYRVALARPPSASEQEKALAYLENQPARLKNFAWLLFNLDEFLYVR